MEIPFEPWLSGHLPKAGGDIFIDIGASTGEWTKSLCKHYKKVIAFEPSRIARRMFGRIPLNVELRPGALWDSAGAMNFYLRRSLLHGSLVKEIEIIKGPITGVRKVAVVPLDSISSIKDVDLIKIDTCGAEVQVLNGALKTISKWKPQVIIEVYTPEARGQVEKILLKMKYEVSPVYHPDYEEGSGLRESHLWLVGKPAEVIKGPTSTA